MSKIQSRERQKRAIRKTAQDATGFHDNGPRTFVGDRAKGGDLVKALQLENQKKFYPQDRDLSSPEWGYFKQIEGIDY
jgi:hypothetical protein